MKEQACIKDMYFPSQPSVKDDKEGVFYREIFPHSSLSNHIYCYWQLKSEIPLDEPFYYRAVADGCFDLIFDCQNSFKSYIMGFSTAHKMIPLGDSFNYIGIRFLPAAFPAKFNIDASELTNKIVNLDLILPELSKRLCEIMFTHSKLNDLRGHLDYFFIKQFGLLTEYYDPILQSALKNIFRLHGNLSIEKDLDVGLSLRQLRRLFKFYLGDTPKAFSKIVRFQSILEVNPSAELLRKHKIYFHFGFYDQAHFTREFKKLYGLPPTQAFLK